MYGIFLILLFYLLGCFVAALIGNFVPGSVIWLILHGRYVCLARRPKCDQCGLTPWCRYYGRKEK